MSQARLTPTERRCVYVALVVVNAALVAAHQVWNMPPAYAEVVLMASLLASTLIKQYTSDSTTPEDALNRIGRDLQ